MKKIGWFVAFLMFCLLPQATLQAQQQWETTIKNKVKINAHAFPDQVHEALDFAAFKSNVNEEPHLVVMIRNGHHKMGASSIEINYLDSPATIKVGRIQIAKPMSLISSQPDGSHLFEMFVENGNSYQILYTVEGGELSPQISIQLMEEGQ